MRNKITSAAEAVAYSREMQSVPRDLWVSVLLMLS
jgi:hypothetical protein